MIQHDLYKLSLLKFVGSVLSNKERKWNLFWKEKSKKLKQPKIVPVYREEQNLRVLIKYILGVIAVVNILINGQYLLIPSPGCNKKTKKNKS